MVKVEKIVYLYGSGTVGKKCLKTLKSVGIKVRAFITSHDYNDGKYIEGVEVKHIDKISDKDDTIIITTFEKYYDEIKTILIEKHFVNFFTWEDDEYYKMQTEYMFQNRSGNKDKLCMVLTGYKEYLYDVVFDRIKAFQEDDVDYCLLTSGKYDKKVEKICEDNSWSYLSTSRNHVGLIQNLAIHLFPDAEYIFKLDEDIFITKNYFSSMMSAFHRIEKENKYKIGFLAPLIPVNSYGYIKILERLNLVEEYTERFESPCYGSGLHLQIDENPETAKFFWGEELPTIDELNEKFSKEDFSYSACPVRFSIGAILYKRVLWKSMAAFTVAEGSGMGSDEVEICMESMKNSRAIIVTENIVVGHLGFRKQNEEMMKFFYEHPQRFIRR